MSHAACLVAQAALLAGDGLPRCTASEPVTLTVGELAERIWRLAGPGGETEIEHLGICAIEGEIPTAGPAWVIERLPAKGSREEARGIWLEAMQRPGLLAQRV